MNPVFPVTMTHQVDLTDPNPGATLPAAPRRPSQPTPVLSSVQAKSAKPALLSLKLNLPKNSGEADGHHAGPSSPSSRSKTKVQRAITEVGGQKRTIDGLDGPGSTEAKSGKRQKTSTPPGSPRNNAAPLKQLVRQSRPVNDLKAMAGLSPRRAGTASPPASPRMAGAGDSANSAIGQDAGSAQANLAALDTLLSSSASQPGGRPDEYLLDFTFSECSYGDDGELRLIQQPRSSTEDRLTLAGTVPPKSQSFTSTIILAELVPKARSQKIAAASYIAGISCQAVETADTSTDRVSKGRRALAELLKTKQAGLETELILVELALGQNVMADMTDYLNTTAARLADMKLSLADLAALDGDGDAGSATVATRLALSTSLDALEVACQFGVGLLADDQVPSQARRDANRDRNAAGMARTAQQADPVITPSNAALLAELASLDALLDTPILPARSHTAANRPKKQ